MAGGERNAAQTAELDAARMTESEFVARHPHAFVSFDAPEEDDDLNFMTELGEVPATRKAIVVAPIVKRENSPFPDRISVGRTRNSDVVIRHSSVSKLHAHFRKDASGMTLTDVGSHNGTKVDGKALVPHQAVAVRVGASVVFGAVQAKVLDAKSAYELLRRS